MELKQEIMTLLKNKNLKLTAAESITGGKLISSLIEIPGASNVIEQAYVVYSNNAKIEVLGVAESTIKQYGVVSEQVALEMARNAKALAKADIAVATTGEAGPVASEANAKIGNVAIAIIILKKEYSYEINFAGDRMQIINQAVEFIFNELRRALKER